MRLFALQARQLLRHLGQGLLQATQRIVGVARRVRCEPATQGVGERRERIVVEMDLARHHLTALGPAVPDEELDEEHPDLVRRVRRGRRIADDDVAAVDEDRNSYERIAYKGLRSPRESALTGRESTESYFFGGHEVHITADVAPAFWQYYLVTGDLDWLEEEGWPVLSGTAGFWVSRSTRGEDGQYHVLNVTPPDEWASNGNRGRDDNPYTNVAAPRNLEIALQAADILGAAPPDGWAERAGNFAILVDEAHGVVLEYADYDGRTIKQADVVMLTYRWQQEQSDELTAADLDHYSTKDDEDASPSMTDAMHAIVAEELGRADDALTFT